MKDEMRIVDALVRHTVRRVLFPDTPKPSQSSHSPVRVNTHKTDTVTDLGLLPFTVGSHHAHVLSYASWSDAQLEDERRRLQSFLRITQQKRQHRPEEEPAETETEADEIGALEAVALLHLFLRERDTSAEATESTRLLHAQLALFAQYYEKCHGRKIRHEFDILAIQRTYDAFLAAQ